MARENYNQKLQSISNFNLSNSDESKNDAISSIAYNFSNGLSSNKDKITDNSSPLGNIGFTSDGNILNDYYNVAYHFTLSMMSDVYDDIKKSNKVVIAESGATTIDILSIRCSETLAPNFRTSNTQWCNFEIQLFEPMGSVLYEKLYESAKELQVQNIQKCFYNLELYFQGYDSSGNPKIIDGKKWNWPLTITDITTQLDGSGCKHTLNMIVAYCEASTDTFNVIPQSFKLDGNTVGDILSSLASNLNQLNYDTYQVPMIKYKFDYLPYPSGANASVTTPKDLNVNLSNYDQAIIRNPDGAHVAAGTTIDELISSLMSNSEDACRLINPGRKIDNIPIDPKDKKPNSFFVSLKTDMKIGTYHPLYSDYEREITYTLVPYDLTRLYGNLSKSTDISDTDYNKKKIKYMCDKKYLRKLYDYIFTGDNTEILNFDIVSNFSYYAIQDYMLGMNHNSSIEQGQSDNSTVASQKLSDQQLKQQEQLKSDKASIEQRLASNKSRQTHITNLKNQIVSLQSQISSDPSNTELSKNLSTLQDQLKQVTSLSDTGLNSDASSYFNMDIQSRKSISEKLKSTPNTQYSDDYDESILTKNDNFVPVSLRYDVNSYNKTSNYNLDSYPDNRRSMFMSMLQQLYEPTGANLINIKLTIRGDPYWLGASFMGTNYNSNDIATELLNSNNSTTNYPISFLNETSFVLRFNSPDGFNENGNVKLSKGNFFSGFYNCIQVDHEFSNGEYKQILDGIIIPGTSYDAIMGN